MGQTIENQLRRRLSERQVQLKRIINEINRTNLTQTNANFELGPFGAYITLETWGEDEFSDQNNGIIQGQNGLLAILGELTGINPNILSNIFGSNHPLGGDRRRVISDALPPIIDKYVDESQKSEIGGKEGVIGKERIEIGGVADFPNQGKK